MHSLYLLYYLKFFQIKRSLCSSTIAWKYMWFVLYLFSIKIESLKIRTVGFVSACRAAWLRWCSREGVCVLLSRGELLCWSQNWSLLCIGIQATVLICPLVSHLLLKELILLELPQMSFGGSLVSLLLSPLPGAVQLSSASCQLPGPGGCRPSLLHSSFGDIPISPRAWGMLLNTHACARTFLFLSPDVLKMRPAWLSLLTWVLSGEAVWCVVLRVPRGWPVPAQ